MQDGQKTAVYESNGNEITSELEQPIWAVISFERCEAAGLTFSAAVRKLSELETANVSGLCIVTAAAAGRLNPSNA